MQTKAEFDLSTFPLWTALITPFTDEGEVNYDDLLGLLKTQEKANNGILILGSTGEALNIDLQTRKQIVDFCCEQELSVPLMVGIGGIMLKETKAWIEWLNDRAIHSLLLVTPLYAKPGHKGQTAWFKTLLDAAQVPCVLYNIPGRTAVSLNFDTVSDMLHHPNFLGIKEASGDVDTFKSYCRAAPGKLMYCGDDGLMPEFARAGALGLISVASNVWPEATHLYVNQTLTGAFVDLGLWKRASSALMKVSNPVPVKCLMHHKGMISSAYLQLPLHADELDDLDALIKQDNSIEDWYTRQSIFTRQAS